MEEEKEVKRIKSIGLIGSRKGSGRGQNKEKNEEE